MVFIKKSLINYVKIVKMNLKREFKFINKVLMA